MTQQEELAARVYEARGKAAQRAKRLHTPPPPFYMMNLGHPVVRALYDAWKAARPVRKGTSAPALPPGRMGGRGIWPQDPPGDVERTEFELSLLSAETREAVQAYLDRIEAMRAGAEDLRKEGKDNETADN